MAPEIEKFEAAGNPLISIIVLNCNGANWLPKCFETILAQKPALEAELIQLARGY